MTLDELKLVYEENKQDFLASHLHDAIQQIAALKRDNGALIEWGKAIMAEANPLILLHQARNPNNQTPLPRCAETWKNLPENIQALLTTEEQEDA